MYQQDRYLWLSLLSLVFGVFLLAFYDRDLRPAAIDFAKIALGGILGLISAKNTPRMPG